jgi:hypothetical protein
MNILCLTDQTINRTDLGQVHREIAEIYKTNADIDIKYHYEYVDFTNYPIEQYWGGFYGMQTAWLRAKCAEVYKRWAEEIDGVVFAVHSSNWKLDDKNIVGDKPVWGWNMSSQFSGYGVQQVRVAQVATHTTQRNINNSVGVQYHEMMHDHDGMVFIHTGETVEPVVNVNNWDNQVVHGEHPTWSYIKHKENQEALKMIAPLLREALANRRALFAKRVGLLQQIIQLQQQVVVLLRAKIAAERGNLPILENNKCIHYGKVK